MTPETVMKYTWVRIIICYLYLGYFGKKKLLLFWIYFIDYKVLIAVCKKKSESLKQSDQKVCFLTYLLIDWLSFWKITT